MRNERDLALKEKKLAVEKIGSIKADTKVQIDKAEARMEIMKYEVDKHTRKHRRHEESWESWRT